MKIKCWMKPIFFKPGVNFIYILCTHYSYERLFSSSILALNKLSHVKFAQKNVDEIDTRRFCTNKNVCLFLASISIWFFVASFQLFSNHQTESNY